MRGHAGGYHRVVLAYGKHGILVSEEGTDRREKAVRRNSGPEEKGSKKEPIEEAVRRNRGLEEKSPKKESMEEKRLSGGTAG